MYRDTLDSVARLSATAQQVLRFVGVLALAAFNHDLVAETIELAEEDARRALGELVNYGVLVPQQSRYEVSHPLIHTYARQARLSGEGATQQAALIARLVMVLTEHFPQVDHANWEACERLVPHIQAVAAHLEQQSTAQAEAAALFNQAGWYLQARARYEQAAPLYRRALAICEQELGANHPSTQMVRQNYTSLLQAFSPRNEQH